MKHVVFGDVKPLRASERSELEKIAERRTNPKDLVHVELAKKASSLAHKLNSQLGLLIGRDGRIVHVVLGSKDRIYLPDLGRFRLDSARLRNLRLVVFMPDADRRLAQQVRDTTMLNFGRINDERRLSGRQYVEALPFPEDLLTDLEKLRLDGLLLVAVDETGAPGAVSFAFLKPPEFRTSKLDGTQRSVNAFFGRDLYDLQLDFEEFISELEAQFTDLTAKAVERADERAILVGAYTGSLADARASMDELVELARTAGLEIVDEIFQRRPKLDPRTLLGKGKIEQLVLRSLNLGAGLLIFDRELSPGQLRSITDLTELKVIDRSMLILDIFAQRAQSAEGRLQVELAQLKYSLPRLTEKASGLSRLTGGIGGRGPGETKLEISRRRVRDRISELDRRIQKVAEQREMRRGKRRQRGVPVVAIVGYTNSGKSTLLNALTKSEVLVESKLFATLDPASRRMRFPNEREVIFVDTVGFIRELPKELVNAFRATLEEVGEADLLLHLVDATNPEFLKQIEVVAETLKLLGFADKRRILVLNKVDLLSEMEVRTLTNSLSAMAVSALEREGFQELVLTVQQELVEVFEGQDPGHFVHGAPAEE